ncbi:MAG TPA: zf-HC2 domain-containing protein [Pyrinomonadaceae bacterium]|nr:zf-HC2 domain-containing protein [Pyrinomonadaceae bacterium]
MRQEANNEMDLLLRRLGRQQQTSASGDHLDADELSSYAENVLPPAARARYSEHLAECTRCRDLVVQLSSSAGVVVAQETAQVSAPSALRKFLASIFSPMVLRYAVPALGLVIVAAIGFMVSRNEGISNSPVADVRYKQPDQGLAASQPSSSLEKEPSAFLDSRESPNKAVTAHDSITPSGTPAANAAPASPVATDAPKDTEEQAKKVDEERQQPEAKEAEPPKPAAAVSGLKKLEPKQEAAEQTVTVTNEPAAEKAKTENRSVNDFTVATPLVRKRAEAGSTTGAASAKPMAQREDTADRDKNDAETRTVAGHHFRKQGGVWIDTAYNSQSLTELKRGSEQYRGLVGDEPEIRQIASQLEGDIIVVWKGKGYKIH